MPTTSIRRVSVALLIAAALAAAAVLAAVQPTLPPTAVAEVMDVPPKGPPG